MAALKCKRLQIPKRRWRSDYFKKTVPDMSRRRPKPAET